MQLTDEDTGDAIFAQLRASGVTADLEATQKQLEQGSGALTTTIKRAAEAALGARARRGQVLVLEDLVKAARRALRRKQMRRYEAGMSF